jgi:hypothetical protein
MSAKAKADNQTICHHLNRRQDAERDRDCVRLLRPRTHSPSDGYSKQRGSLTAPSYRSFHKRGQMEKKSWTAGNEKKSLTYVLIFLVSSTGLAFPSSCAGLLSSRSSAREGVNLLVHQLDAHNVGLGGHE